VTSFLNGAVWREAPEAGGEYVAAFIIQIRTSETSLRLAACAVQMERRSAQLSVSPKRDSWSVFSYTGFPRMEHARSIGSLWREDAMALSGSACEGALERIAIRPLSGDEGQPLDRGGNTANTAMHAARRIPG